MAHRTYNEPWFRSSGRILAFLLWGAIAMAPQASHADATSALALRQAAVADSLDTVIDRLVDEERYVKALGVAARQTRLRLNALGPRAPETLRSFHRIAIIAHRSGDQDTAGRVCNVVLALREAELGPDHPDVAESLALEAVVAKYAVKFDESLSYIERGLEILKKTGLMETETAAVLLQARANVLRRLGFRDDISDYEGALQIRRSLYCEPAFPLADNLVWFGWTLMQHGRHEEAFRCFDEAESILRRIGLERHSLMGVLLAARAEGHVVAGRWSDADRLYRQATPILAARQRGFFPGFSRRKLPLNAGQPHALVLLKMGRWEKAWLAKQRFANDIQMDFVSLAGWRDVDPDGYAAVRVLRRQLLELRSELQEKSEPGFKVDAAALSDDFLRRFALRFELMADLLAREQRYVNGQSNDQVSIADVQRYLRPGSAYLGVVQTSIADYVGMSSNHVLHSMWVYVIRPEGPITWVPVFEFDTSKEYLEATQPQGRFLTMLRFQSEWPLRMESDAELTRYAAKTTQLLLGSVLKHLDGVSELIVEFSNIFEGTSLESLVDSEGVYLSDRFATAYVPSAAAFVAMEKRRRPRKKLESVLAVGGAVFNESDDVLEGGRLGVTLLRAALDRDPAALDRLPRLPFAEYEVEHISRLFPSSTVLSRSDASEERLNGLAPTGDMTQFDVIHVATHCLIDAFPERCALALSRANVDGSRSNDGLIETDEMLLGWKLDAEVVTLSGCQTAHLFGHDGRYLGLSTAMIGVGVRSVVASRWKVDDQATAILMTRFYDDLTRATPMNKAEALADARRAVRNYEDEDGHHPFEHPAYWAAFILIGSPY